MHQKCLSDSQQINLSIGTTDEFTFLSQPCHSNTGIEDYPRRLHLCNWLVDNGGTNVLALGT
jgi:hypothetical protein